MPADDPKRETRIPGHPEGLPPETHNDEQEDRDAQAQNVAADARDERSHTSSPLESTKREMRNLQTAPASKGDLVDEMRRMEGQGRIDMSAYAGEPNHDDEEGTYGGETTDDDDEEWLTADGEATAEEADLLDREGLIEEVELSDLDDGTSPGGTPAEDEEE